MKLEQLLMNLEVLLTELADVAVGKETRAEFDEHLRAHIAQRKTFFADHLGDRSHAPQPRTQE